MFKPSAPTEVKQFLDVNMLMVDTLDFFCKSSLATRGICEGCPIQEILEARVKSLLISFDMKPCDFDFAHRLRTIFNELGVEEGFWTIRRLEKGWRMSGAGFRMSHWPKDFKHDPLQIFFQIPSNEPTGQRGPIALQFSSMKVIIDSMFRATKGKINEDTVNSLKLPKALKDEILYAANEEWHLGVLLQNKNQDFQTSEYFGFWKAPLWGDLPPSTTDIKFYLFP